MRNIHCRIGRRTTGKPPTSLLPSIDFFVCQDGAQFRAPIHRNLSHVSQANAVGIGAADRWQSVLLFVSGLNQEL